MDKILVVKKEAAEKQWMKSMPDPLKENQKVVVSNDQADVVDGYVRVKHGKGSVSVFDRRHFKTLKD